MPYFLGTSINSLRLVFFEVFYYQGLYTKICINKYVRHMHLSVNNR